MISIVSDTLAESRLSSLNGIPASAIRSQLNRVLQSHVFIHSRRIRRFLEFVVEESITGQQHRLKEYLIGLEVFNRSESFDPRGDSIVRVEARRLRAKLDHYYRTEGYKDEIRIELRKGSYIPYFEQRRDNPQDSGYFDASPRRRSIALARFSANPPRDSDELLKSIRRRLTHVLVSEGFSQVIADPDLDGPADFDYKLSGDIEYHDGTAKVMLQMMSVPDGACISSAVGEVTCIEEMARTMNRSLINLGSHAANGRSQRHRVHSHSLGSYLEGRYLWKSSRPGAIRSSVDRFTSAVEADPSYTSAWCALAESLLVSCVLGLCDSGQARLRIQEAARKAVEMNSSLPEAYVAWGAAQSLLEWKWQEGEQALLRAIQLDSRDGSAYAALALQLACRGMSGSALIQIERALELDPACLYSNFLLGWLKGVAGNSDQAISQHELIVKLAPDFALARLGLGWAHASRGKWAEAARHFESAAGLIDSPVLLASYRGAAHARTGNEAAALAQIEALKNQGGSDSNVGIAGIYACLGDSERAFEYLHKSADKCECSLPLRLLNPEFETLKGDSRFSPLLERIGLKAQQQFELHAVV